VSNYQSPMERQIALEQEMTAAGIARYEANRIKAMQEQRASEVPAGQRLLTAAIEPMTKAIAEYQQASRSGKPGRAAVATKTLDGMDPAVVAYITARAVLDRALTGECPLQRTAIVVGHLLEDEVRFTAFQRVAKDKFDLTERNLKGARHMRYRRRVMVYQMNKNGLAWKEWPERTTLLVGIKLIEMFAEATGLIEIITVDGGRYKVRASQTTMDWLEKSNARHAILCPIYMPCLVQPKPWTTPLNGGYHTEAVRRPALIKTRSKGFLDELFNADLSQVYDALNTLQSTAWRVNPKVLSVAREMWDKGIGLGKVLPARNGVEVPPKPAWLANHAMGTPLPDLTEEQKAEFKAWKSEAADAHTAHAQATSRRLQAARVITIAERFAPEEAIYFPYTLDFRGRIYAVPPFLNPQGNDLAKGLLTFAQGKPIGDTTGPGWLAIHGANTYGYDKAALEDRIAWVEEHQRQIMECAADPVGTTFWQDADNPWCFLAFCFEWAGYTEAGAAYVSSLPVALDGSCNGIQHFSAMLRDPVGGAAVNLVPSDKPSDIYARVAEVATAKLCLIRSTGGDDAGLAKLWLDFGIDRKITKRSVMVLPYGGTYMSCKSYVEEAVRERGAPPMDRQAFHKAIHFLAKVVWSSISEVVVGARECMAWLQACARLATKTNLPINWRTPSGQWVQQAYREIRKFDVEVKVFGQRARLKLADETPEIDAAKQITGIAPNFVHSLDAAALVACVNTAAANGIQSFAMIHDSYGTLAADTDMLGACLRTAFVDLYKEHDVLAEFRETIIAMLPPELAEKVPPLPAKGSLDIDAVLSSDFFFA
jgi:DNA-directed RNA polymerase